MERDRIWILPGLIIALTAMVLAASLRTALAYPGRPSGTASIEATVAILVVTAFFRLMRHLFRLWRSGEPDPITHLRDDFLPAAIGTAPIAAGVVILGFFLYSITFLKSMITGVVPFWSDHLF